MMQPFAARSGRGSAISRPGRSLFFPGSPKARRTTAAALSRHQQQPSSVFASSQHQQQQRQRRCGVVASAAAGDPLSWNPDEIELLLDGRIDKCDLVEAFCRAAIQQQGRPREDVYSFLEPPSVASSSKAAASPTFPAWCELMQSLDSTDVIDWSDVENDGKGVTAEQHFGGNGDFGASGGSSSSSSSSGGHPPAAAAAVGAGRHCGCRGALCSNGAGGSVSRRRRSSSSVARNLWGGSACRATAAKRGVAVWAVPANKQAETESDDAVTHYDGADSDTLFPPGSLELDDPGHPTDVLGSDTQASVIRPEAKPYMNIKGGRWVPPSKAQAEQMMIHLSNMGPDEGV